MAHSHHLHREHQVSHRRVAHILKDEPAGAKEHSHRKAFSKVTSKTGAEHHDAFVAGARGAKRYARGGKVKKGHQTNIAIVVPHHGPGAGATPAIPGGMPPGGGPGGPPPPMAAPGGPPPMGGAPGMPPGMPMHKRGGRVHRAGGGCVKAGGGGVSGESTKPDIKKWGKEAKKESYAKGGFVKPKVIERAGARSGQGRLEKAARAKRH